MPTKADLIRETTLWLHGVALTPTRAAELAAEIDGLNAAVGKEADTRLSFDSDPSAFPAVLKSAR
jgi:hypothetical protein